MAKVKLSRVATLATRDPAFFKALQNNVVAALADKNLELTNDDMTTLRTMLSTELHQAKINIPELIAWVNRELGRSGVPVGQIAPDVWEVDWGTEWQLTRKR
jgi:hypothetical protein